MLSTYKQLTSVAFRHVYNLDTGFKFASPEAGEDEVFDQLTAVAPKILDHNYRFVSFSIPKREQKKMVDLGIVFKTTANGFQLLYNELLFDKNQFLEGNYKAAMHQSKLNGSSAYAADIEHAVLLGEERMEGMSLHIEVQLTDSNFFNYTSGGAAKDGSFATIANSIFYFTNSEANKQVSETAALLHRESYTGLRDLRTLHATIPPEKFDAEVHYPDVFLSKPFAVIKLKLLPDLRPQYYINFDSKVSHWKYIVLTEPLNRLIDELMEDADKPAIIDQDGKTAFSGPEKIAVKGDREVYSFTSANPIKCKTTVRDPLSLVAGYVPATSKYKKIILNTLPVPDVKFISSYTKETKQEDPPKNMTEIFF